MKKEIIVLGLLASTGLTAMTTSTVTCNGLVTTVRSRHGAKVECRADGKVKIEYLTGDEINKKIKQIAAKKRKEVDRLVKQIGDYCSKLPECRKGE